MSRSGASVCAALALLASVTAAGPVAWGSSAAQRALAQTSATFGKTTIGASKDTFLANRKRVNCYALATEGSITQLSVYLAPAGATGTQSIEGVLYAASAGAPSALLGTSSAVTFSNTNAAGWYPLSFTTPLKLAAGNYCIGVLTGSIGSVAGFRYDSVANSRELNTNTYSSGPSDPFGAFSTDSEQMSIYATYTAGPPPPPPPRPVNVQPPVISGTAQSGSTLSTTEGTWSESPTSYAYEWQRCNTAGEECTQISGAKGKSYTATAPDVGSTLRVAVTASNSGGASAPASSAQTAVVSSPPPPPRPVNVNPPVISGNPQSGSTLSASEGTWTENPTAYAYEWQRCNTAGEECARISGAAAKTYTAIGADVGSTLRVAVTASNSGGPSTPSTSAQTAVVSPPPSAPVNTAPPTISGAAASGQTLTATTGSWTEGPSAYAYQWQRCNTAGEGCQPITLATASTYTAVAADIGSTLRVGIIASNSTGPSGEASSAHTAVVTQAPQTPRYFGKTTVGASKDTFLANRKRVNCYALATEGSITQLSVYLAPAGATGTQSIEGVLYAASAGAPSALLGTSSAVTFSNTNAAGWYPLSFTTPLKLAAGNYCIGVLTGSIGSVAGFRYDSVANSRELNTNTYSSGPSDPFGAFSTDSEQMSIYATYTAGPPPPPPPRPVNVQPPVISGTAQSGSTLSTTEGTWSESPTSYAYEWQRCNTAGEECTQISGAKGKSYTATAPDVGSTLRVAVTASNSGGASTPASSAQTAVVSSPPPPGGPPTRPEGLHSTFVGPAQINLSWSPSTDEGGIAGYTIRRDGVVIANTGSSATSYSDNGRTPATEYGYTVEAYDASGGRSPQSLPARVSTASSVGVQHYEYVFPAHAIDVYDMDNAMKLVKTISLPQATDMRGAAASPATGMLYVSYGGDGGGSGGGSMLAYDLVREAVAWTHAYPEGIDSMSISPDGKTIYMPVGEASSASTWNVLDASNGNITATIQGGQAPHNTIVSLNGEHVYMGGRRAKYLTVADTATNLVTKSIGPLLSETVRPFTINGAETLAFTTATGFLGFQVSSITSGQVLYTAPITGGFPYTPGQAGPSSPSHGISLSPDEKELWVIDQPNSYVHVFDVSGLPGSPPKQIADIKVRSMTGSQSGCTYDCLREGWLQHSRDGRFVFVGDSGDVIDTTTRQSVANLETLYNSRVFLEVDWRNGLPVATTSRSGLGYVVP